MPGLEGGSTCSPSGIKHDGDFFFFFLNVQYMYQSLLISLSIYVRTVSCGSKPVPELEKLINLMCPNKVGR